MSNEYEVTEDDNIWPQTDSGEGLPEAMGGWGRIDKQGKLDREELEDGQQSWGPGVGMEVNGAMDEQFSTQLAVLDGESGGDGDGDDVGGAGTDSYGRAGDGIEVSVSTVCNRDDADDDSEDDGNDDRLYFALHDENGEPLEGLPGERSSYAAGAGGGHDEEGDLEDVLDDAEVLAHGTGSSLADDLDVSRIQERLVFRGGDGDDTGEAREESVVKGEQIGGGDEGNKAFLHSWDDLVEGVEDEAVLHGHGRAGLPDPLVDDELLEDEYGIQVANGGVASYMEQFENTEGLERDLRADDDAADEACDVEQGRDEGGDGVACEEELDDGYQSGFEGRSGEQERGQWQPKEAPQLVSTAFVSARLPLDVLGSMNMMRENHAQRSSRPRGLFWRVLIHDLNESTRVAHLGGASTPGLWFPNLVLRRTRLFPLET